MRGEGKITSIQKLYSYWPTAACLLRFLRLLRHDDVCSLFRFCMSAFFVCLFVCLLFLCYYFIISFMFTFYVFAFLIDYCTGTRGSVAVFYRFYFQFFILNHHFEIEIISSFCFLLPLSSVY